MERTTTNVRDAARVPGRRRGGVVRVHARRLHRRPARGAADSGAKPTRVCQPDRACRDANARADRHTRHGAHWRGLRGRDGREPVVVGPGRPAADDRCAEREPDQHRAHRPAVPARGGLPRGPQFAVGRQPAGQHPDDPAGGPRRDRNGGRGRAGPGGRTGADAVRQRLSEDPVRGPAGRLDGRDAAQPYRRLGRPARGRRRDDGPGAGRRHGAGRDRGVQPADRRA